MGRQMDTKSGLTFTLEALFDHPPKKTSAVVAEGRAHVVVGLKTMWHVDLEALFLELQTHKRTIIYLPQQTQRSVTSPALHGVPLI